MQFKKRLLTSFVFTIDKKVSLLCYCKSRLSRLKCGSFMNTNYPNYTEFPYITKKNLKCDVFTV